MKTAEGNLSTILRVDTFTLKLEGDVTLKQMKPFFVNVNFEYWAATHSTDFEEPSEPEYIEIQKVSTINDVYLTDSRGVMLHLSSYARMLDLLDETKYNKIVDAISLKQDFVKL